VGSPVTVFPHEYCYAPREAELVFGIEEGADGFVQLGGGGSFDEAGVGAGFLGLLSDLRGIVHGEDDDFRVGCEAPDLPGGFESVHYGHADVEDDEVGLEIEDFLYGFFTVLSFAANIPAVDAIEQRLHAATHNFVVVYEQNLRSHSAPFGKKQDVTNEKVYPLGRESYIHALLYFLKTATRPRSI
jgi:hypothetical protein